MTNDERELVEEIISKEIFFRLMVNPYWINIQHNTALCAGISEYLKGDVLSAIKQNYDLVPKAREGRP